MKLVLFFVLSLFFCICCCVSEIIAHLPNHEEGVGYFWHISDPHVDKEYKVGSDPDCGLPLCCREEKAGQKRKAGEFGTFGPCDIPPKTMYSALEFVRDYPVNPDYVFYGGDNAVHEIWHQSRDAIIDYAKYVRNAIVDTLSKDQKFNNCKIFATIGNHDVYPVDQLDFPPHSSWILETIASLFFEWLTDEAYQTFRYYGYFSMILKPGLKFINLNTQYNDPLNFFIYKNTTDPGDQISWLTNELEEARQKNQKIWMLGHIPPGINNRGIQQESVVRFNEAFQKLMQKYGDLVVFQLYGHTHEDSFKIMWDEKFQEPTTVGFVVPGMTNYHNQNPAVRLFKYNSTSYELLDMMTFYGNLTEANNEGKMTWRLEYSAIKDLQLKDMSAKSFAEYWNRMDTDLSWWLKFEQYYHVNHMIQCPSGNAKCKSNQICSIAYLDYDHFYECMEKRK